MVALGNGTQVDIADINPSELDAKAKKEMLETLSKAMNQIKGSMDV